MIFMAGGNAYSLFHEHKSGWNPEAFRERFSDVLDRFDYIVGDWGYNQLRLRGFYRDGHPRATKESSISSFVDYINEYCNFGCAYFVLNKLDSNALPPEEEISKEESPEVIVAMNESEEQEAETAAAASLGGPIMRWPLKERLGGPVRAPIVTVSAVARAAADAERRNSSTNAASNTSATSPAQTRGSHSRQGQGNPSANKQPYPPRNPRAQGTEQANRIPEDTQSQETNDLHNDASRNDSRWSSKNRRRKSFGGKPNYRPDGAPHPDIGNPRSGE
jgi:uncharacterized protein YutD